MVDISSLHVPPGDAPRRQNRSCDQCRSTKRRCLVSTTGDSRGRVKCTTCKRLGHECTFNFARSQSTKSKKQRNGHDTLQRAESDGPIGVASDVFTQSAAPFLHGCETANGSQDPWESGVGFPAPWPDNSPPSFDAFFNGLEPTFTPAPPEDDVSNVMPHGASSHPPGQSVPDQLLRASSQMVARCGVPHSSAIAWSRPLLLLNSSLTGKIVDEHLARIYNAIVAGNSSRWLQCELSSPAKGYRAAIQGNAVSLAYPISDEPWNNLLDGMLYPVVMAALPPSHQALPETIEAVEPTTNLSTSDMTLLGAVRFLDHFSGMYGNKLGPLAKHLSDTALRDVLKIYAMQWLPAKHDSKLGQARSRPQNHDTLNTSTSSMSALYHDAWFCAKTSIGRARYVRSFRVVYATLLLDATAAPEQLQDWHDSKSSLLDHAFSTLRELAFLIRRYVKALGSLSIYGMMLEKGLELIEFFSYLRDTVSSLIDDRRCKVPDDLAKGRLQSFLHRHQCVTDHHIGIPQTSLDSLGNSPAQYQIDHFNRRCFSRLLMTLRKMMAVKKAYVEAIPRDHQTPGEHHGSLLSSAFKVIDEMETLLRPVIDASIKGFDSLEAEFKVQIRKFRGDMITVIALANEKLSQLR